MGVEHWSTTLPQLSIHSACNHTPSMGTNASPTTRILTVLTGFHRRLDTWPRTDPPCMLPPMRTYLHSAVRAHHRRRCHHPAPPWGLCLCQRHRLTCPVPIVGLHLCLVGCLIVAGSAAAVEAVVCMDGSTGDCKLVAGKHWEVLRHWKCTQGIISLTMYQYVGRY